MFPIYHNCENQEGYGFDTFSEKMISICNEHREDGRALAFAFLFYDFRNAHLWKVLSDRQYWKALDSITGAYLSVFSFRYREERRRKRLIHPYNMEKMVPVTATGNPRNDSNILLKNYFGIDQEISYPAILFFQVKDDVIIDTLLVNLEEEFIETGFLELKDYLSNAVRALERIAPENRGNSQEIFNCLELEVSNVLTPVKDSTSPVQRFQPSHQSYDSSSDSWISCFFLNAFHCFSDSVG